MNPQSDIDISQEEGLDLRSYLQVIRKRKWIVIIVFLIITITTITQTMKLRSVYQATARILIEGEAPKIIAVEDVLQLDADSFTYFETQFEIIKSRKLVGKVIDELNLDKHPEFVGKKKEDSETSFSESIKSWLIESGKNVITMLGMGGKQEEKPMPDQQAHGEKLDPKAIQREILHQIIVSRLEIARIGTSRLVGIRMTGYDPQIITKVVNTLAKIYIEQNLENRLFASEDASIWLDKRVQSMQKKVEDSEKKLQTYSRSIGVVSFSNRMESIEMELTSLNGDIIQAKKKRMTLATLYESSKDEKTLGYSPEIVKNQLIQSFSRDLSQLEVFASQLRKKYGSKHPKIVQLQSQIDTINKTIELEIKKIQGSIKTELELAKVEESSLTDALEKLQKEAAFLDEKSIRYRVLKRDMESNRQMFDLLLQRLKETDLSLGLRNNNIRIIDLAFPPLGPFKPNKRKNISLGVFFGLICGVGLAFVIESLDTSIKEPDEIVTRFKIPFLGLLGTYVINHEKHSSKENIIILKEPLSNISESLRTIRTNILFSVAEGHEKTLMITSALPAEGKTTISCNLAATMATMGEKTILVDADLHRPSIHKNFALKRTPGLTSYLIGKKSLDEIIHKTSEEKLDIIPSGILPPNPAELLSLPQMESLIHKLGEKYERIIIDTPPVASVTDPLIIGKMVGGTIVVIRCGETSRENVKRAIDQLRNVHTHVIGAILNAVDFRKDSYYYHYYYKHYYYKEDSSEEEPHENQQG